MKQRRRMRAPARIQGGNVVAFNYLGAALEFSGDGAKAMSNLLAMMFLTGGWMDSRLRPLWYHCWANLWLASWNGPPDVIELIPEQWEAAMLVAMEAMRSKR